MMRVALVLLGFCACSGSAKKPASGDIKARVKEIERLLTKEQKWRDNVVKELGEHLEKSPDKSKIAQSIRRLTPAADFMWLLLCGALVMFMQPGFAMIEA